LDLQVDTLQPSHLGLSSIHLGALERENILPVVPYGTKYQAVKRVRSAVGHTHSHLDIQHAIWGLAHRYIDVVFRR
jgi:hypothetical protein